MMIKLLAASFLFFTGFLTHALFFPDLLANGITDVKGIALGPVSPTTAETGDSLTTKITYDGKAFDRHNITVPFSRYLTITNQSREKLMWLTSTNPSLTTPRGYGYSEAVEIRMDTKGQFVVADKNNPQEKLIITVN